MAKARWWGESFWPDSCAVSGPHRARSPGSNAPKPTKGFWQACEDVSVKRAYGVAPVREGWPIADNMEVESPADVKAAYRSASFLAGNRVVFNIKGNVYRLVVAMHYDRQIAYIRFVGTHSQYDRIDASTV